MFWKNKHIKCCRVYIVCGIVSAEQQRKWNRREFNVNYRAWIIIQEKKNNIVRMEYQQYIFSTFKCVSMCNFRACQSLKPLSADHYCTINTYNFFNTGEKKKIQYICWLDRKMICVKIQCTLPSLINLFCIESVSCCRETSFENVPYTLFLIKCIPALDIFESRNQSNFFFSLLHICTRFQKKAIYKRLVYADRWFCV